MLPLTLIFRLTDYWYQLSEGTREGIVSGLIVAGVAAVFGLIWKFGARLLTRFRQITGATPEPLPAPSPQEVKVQVEVVPPAPTPFAPPKAPQPFKSPDIPRPPLFGFVARRGEDGRDIVERLKEELAPERNQLIVLWGSGGVGKTTLAAEACRALMNCFPGGIAWISADGKPEFALSTLLDEIATHLRRPEILQLAPQSKDQSLHDALVDSPTPLIVLDNFETISPREQNLCAAWLAKRASCPALITSRDEAPHARPIHILAMSPTEACEFLQKLIAEARKPKVFEELDREKLIDAADRIPLVLEWLVKQIDAAKEPKGVLEDLSKGRGDAAQRVFDRSFELPQLGDDGRTILLALSLFVPSASRDALAEVSGFGSDLGRLEKALQHLDELWLIEATQQNQRVSVQGLTRQLAKARMKTYREAESVRRRFVSYFLNYAQANARPTPEDYEALENERENLLAAMDIAFEIEDWDVVTELASLIALPVRGVLGVHGYWTEALRRNEQAFKAAREASSEWSAGRFTHNQAVIHQNRGESEKARELYARSLSIWEKLGDQDGIASTRHQFAMLAHEKGDWEEAGRLYNESLVIKKKLGDQSRVASTLHQLAMLAHEQGDWEEARRLYDESLVIKKKLGNQSGIASGLHQLGMLMQDKGEFDRAKPLYEQSLEITRKLGDQEGIAFSLHELGRLAQAVGDLKEARRFYNESIVIHKKLGNQRGTALTLGELGRLAQRQGEFEEARQLYNQSLDMFKKLGNQSSIALTLHQLGRVSEETLNASEAEQLFRDALVIWEKLGSPDADIARRSLARVEDKTS